MGEIVKACDSQPIQRLLPAVNVVGAIQIAYLPGQDGAISWRIIQLLAFTQCPLVEQGHLRQSLAPWLKDCIEPLGRQ